MRTFGRYILLERLASGPSSDIHLAWREDDRVLCAMKVLKPRVAKDWIYVDQLLKEVPSATRFHHRASALVHGVERPGQDQLSIAIELVVGQPLAHVLQRAQQSHRPLTRDMILWIAAEAASALQAAHQERWASGADEPMVHGALTPYSIMVTYDGHVKVLGMGLGRSRFYLPPSLVRLAYRAPEVFEANAISTSNDIYALGLIIFEALTNQRLFKRTTTEETRSAILGGHIPRLRTTIENVSDILDELTAVMMSRVSSERPESAKQVEQALRSQFRGSDDVMTGRLAEAMQYAWQDECNAERQLIDVARRKVTRPASGPHSVAQARGNDPFRPLGGDDAEPISATDLLAEAPDPRGPDPRGPDPRAKTPILAGDRRLVPQSGSNPRLTPPGGVPKERRSSASGAAPIAGAPPRPISSLGRIGRFEIVADLGRLGACSIYEGVAVDTKEPAFVKVIDEKKLDDLRLRSDDWIRMFYREVQIAKVLRAPGLPVVLDSEVQGSLHYVAYDRVDGVALNAVIARGKGLPPASVRKAIASAARALHFVHERGFVYCNVQAHNVQLMRDGSARLNDLSMASPRSGPMHPLLMTNVFALAPEYLNGREYEAASDQFALGALLYELLTGTRPFRGLDDKAMLQAICDKDPIAPKTIDSHIDPFLSEVSMRALAKVPGDRFESCAIMADVLEAAVQNTG